MKWPMVKFGSVCKLQNGRAFKPEEWSTSGTPIIRIQNLNDDTKSFNYCDFEVEDRFHVNSGDLLFSWSGTPGTSFGAFFWNRGKGFLNQHIFRVDIDENEVSKNYLRYAINSKLNLIIDQAHGGVGLKHITKGKLEAIEIPLPPLEEQKRIAAILDKADAIRRKRQQAIDLADEFLRSVFLNMFGDPVTNPKGWEVVELNQLIVSNDKLNYGVVQPGEHDEDGVPLVRSGDLSGRTPDKSTIRRVSASVDLKHKKSRLVGNEILIACVGSIGKVGWVSEEMKGWNIARAVTRIPLKSSVNREYIYRYLQSPVVQGYFERETRAVAQPTLNVGLIGKTPIALPSSDLQDEFLSRYSAIESYKNKQLRHLDEESTLFSALSQKAFSGEL
ncbi:restriction endonuclease subunit S [Marinomonas fungiae]|uniref:Restriction endonuclease S subunit n=1 Tax=Marinomonas fungiae TaxID=1137284 RepID=A0A0K6ILA8_9GAMM|nr:restriction endonuclease subunit S [Marinomonas fungiae]CUB04087.1 Restriction endonuclease S subunit [Marinomonas fungiae]